MSEQEYPAEMIAANDGTIDLVKRDEWRLFATQEGFGVEVRAAGMVIAFPVERAVAGRLLAFFTNDEYHLHPAEREEGMSEAKLKWYTVASNDYPECMTFTLVRAFTPEQALERVKRWAERHDCMNSFLLDGVAEVDDWEDNVIHLFG